MCSEVVGWSYHHDLDLTGFIDGTENPSLSEAADVVLVPEGSPGAGGSVLLLQQWVHHTESWTALEVAQQEQVIGRTSQLASNWNRNHPRPTSRGPIRTPSGISSGATPHTDRLPTTARCLSGSAQSRVPWIRCFAAMAGIGGPRDELTRFSTPLTGAYYFVPSLDDLTAIPEQ